MGLKYLRATADEAVAELAVSEQHLKADGTVDEALCSGLVEAAASAGGGAARHCVGSCQWLALKTRPAFIDRHGRHAYA